VRLQQGEQQRGEQRLTPSAVAANLRSMNGAQKSAPFCCREPWLIQRAGTRHRAFHFVTDGVESALEQATEAAGGKDVSLGGGATVVQQYLAAGLLDEMLISLVPVFLGAALGCSTISTQPGRGWSRFTRSRRRASRTSDTASGSRDGPRRRRSTPAARRLRGQHRSRVPGTGVEHRDAVLRRVRRSPPGRVLACRSRRTRLEDHERDLALGPLLVVAIGAVALAHPRP
jgi:dihydrofolate reductase